LVEQAFVKIQASVVYGSNHRFYGTISASLGVVYDCLHTICLEGCNSGQMREMDAELLAHVLTGLIHAMNRLPLILSDLNMPVRELDWTTFFMDVLWDGLRPPQTPPGL
jgi:hypothetical protein